MKKQAFNPYLPGYEYIPDGEPYVFGDRVYLYGSHDRFNGESFCENDYVCWSANIHDLGDWRYEGVIYRKTQDPVYAKGRELFAPDVQQGPDGRFYLYYSLNYSRVMSVAVCDTPAGTYEFYGHIQLPDGHLLGSSSEDILQFDPAILVDEDHRVYLYSGFSPWKEFIEQYHITNKIDGAYVMELEQDMMTIKSGPTLVIPGRFVSEGTGFEGHEFFEASSIRKVGHQYYFVYSSVHMHELCYAISDKPDSGFVYGGTIVSNGDIFFQGRKHEDMLNYAGNNHGSIVEINGQWYVFYHRQTNFHQFSRQDCAEPITIAPDGTIAQVEMTSCGMNGNPLAGIGLYDARIACNLRSKEGAHFYQNEKSDPGFHPYFTQDQPDSETSGTQYIANLRDGATAGFKYFLFDTVASISVWVRGDGAGTLLVSTSTDGAPVAEIAISPCNDWTQFSASASIPQGVLPLYFTFHGKGALDFLAFELRS